MKVMREHRRMLRDLVINHAENIHGKSDEDKLCKEIKETCQDKQITPTSAQNATVKTMPFIKGK